MVTKGAGQIENSREIEMETRIRNGNLIVVLPLEQPKLSATGKTLVVASSRGVRRTTCRIDGEIVCVIANAFVYASGQEDGTSTRKRKKQSTNARRQSHPQRKKGFLSTRHDASKQGAH